MSVYLPLFNALNAARTQYVVVGGLATVLYGYARLLLWAQATPTQLLAWLEEALKIAANSRAGPVNRKH